ncbi:MAG TPA: hypothetical protein VN829_15900 [Dongiaceae bacterium]|nr:hypothetical protein [Dongiaceae bacterium]
MNAALTNPLPARTFQKMISSGGSFHLQAPYVDGPHWFLIQNTYVDTNGLPVTPVFLGEEPSGTNSLPLQFQP